MSTAPGNIFLTTENLAFSLPLIIVCGSYAYFKYVPLNIGLPILLGIFILYQIRAQIIAQRGKKLQNMDDKAMNDLALELEGDEKNGDVAAEKAKKLQRKKEYAVQQRLAAEKKKEAKQSKQNQRKKKGGDDDDDEDALLATFAKGAKSKKTK